MVAYIFGGVHSAVKRNDSKLGFLLELKGFYSHLEIASILNGP